MCLHHTPERQMPPGLQTHSAPTWLTQSIPFEDYETVCVGHQQVKAEVEARPPPAVLRRGGRRHVSVNIKLNTLYSSRSSCRSETVWLTSPSLVSFLPHLILLSSNSSLLASWGLMMEIRVLSSEQHQNQITSKQLLCLYKDAARKYR